MANFGATLSLKPDELSRWLLPTSGAAVELVHPSDRRTEAGRSTSSITNRTEGRPVETVVHGPRYRLSSGSSAISNGNIEGREKVIMAGQISLWGNPGGHPDSLGGEQCRSSLPSTKPVYNVGKREGERGRVRKCGTFHIKQSNHTR